MINSTAPAEASAGVFIRAKVLLEEGAELVEERRSVRDNGGRTGAGTFREELIRISGFAVITGSLLNFIRGELIIIKGGKLQINHYTPAMNHPVHRPRKKLSRFLHKLQTTKKEPESASGSFKSVIYLLLLRLRNVCTSAMRTSRTNPLPSISILPGYISIIPAASSSSRS